MPVSAVIEGERVPVKLWVPEDEVEEAALAQLRRMAALPIVAHHVAVMPDVHLGKGAAVGSVVALRRAVVPACVGVDIGCGMNAVKTPLDAGRVENSVRQIRAGLEAAIPVGFAANREESPSVAAWKGWKEPTFRFLDAELQKKARLQLGSLGGGNHFLEVCLDSERHVWVVLHSGSRHVGKSLAERHIEKAKRLMDTQAVRLPDRDLAWLPEGTPEFEAYRRDLEWCRIYARANRREIMQRALDVLAFTVNEGRSVSRLFEVDCHHNDVARETHFGEELWVTRKGAVRAGRGEYGIVPGSMGTRTYVVRGKGSPDSFESCAHGAGRRMSRAAARRRFRLQDLLDQTRGVESRKDSSLLDEIPGAYKDIEEVMRRQEDLVEIVAELRPVLCVKG